VDNRERMKQLAEIRAKIDSGGVFQEIGMNEAKRKIEEHLAKAATITRPKAQDNPDEVIENLVALVGQLSHALKKANPTNGIPARAMSYVESIGYKFSPNRGTNRG